MVLFWELKFFDLMVRHHAGVMSENHKRGWNFANSHNIYDNKRGNNIENLKTLAQIYLSHKFSNFVYKG